MAMKTLFALLIAFQIKHWLADYLWQTPYMLRKSEGGTSWILPLATHAGVHAGITLVLCLATVPALWWLALIDFAVHFTVDRIKAAPTLGGRYTPAQKGFWLALGADQAAHHITHYCFVLAILRAF